MENKETFDLVANEYNKYRPTYPDELFEDIICYSNIQHHSQILEIGCGTGQATGGFVNRGYTNLTGIELGANLARITANKYSAIDTLSIVHSSFESWEANEAAFDLAFSATAFHFIEPVLGYSKVHRLLKHNGTKAFFWTVHAPLFDKVHEEIRNLYKQLAPHLDDSFKPLPGQVIEERKELSRINGLFDNIIVKQYAMDEYYSSDDYISLLNTHSKHRQLSDEIRCQLFDSMKEIIEKQGGTIRKIHLVALFLGRKT